MIIAGLFYGIENSAKLKYRSEIRFCTYALIGGWLLFLTMVTCQRRTTFSEPITIWSDVLTKYPESRRALNNRAVAWLKKGLPQKTLTDFNTLLRNHPDYARGFENRGRLRLYLGNYSGALTDFERTLCLLPNEPELKAVRKEVEILREAALNEKPLKRKNLR